MSHKRNPIQKSRSSNIPINLAVVLLISINFFLPDLSRASKADIEPFKMGASQTPDLTNFRIAGLEDIDPRLMPRVQFWADIYGKYSSNDALIHDAKYPAVIFEVLSLDPLEDNTQKVKRVKEFYGKVVAEIHHKLIKNLVLTPEEERVAKKYRDHNAPVSDLSNTKVRDRIRMQTGLRDFFRIGYFASGRYLREFERIFKNTEVPVSLSRLPFVESSFNLSARSKVGASGLWQFMPYTGKLYLKMNRYVDERHDPLKATEAAAKLLKQNFSMLGSWELAITAYNHGPFGMQRAKEKTLKDRNSFRLADIIETYSSPTFGFASQNFYCEFLAAVFVDRNAQFFFGTSIRDEEEHSIEFSLPVAMKLHELSQKTKIHPSVISYYNPSWNNLWTDNIEPIEKATSVRVPEKYKPYVQPFL